MHILSNLKIVNCSVNSSSAMIYVVNVPYVCPYLAILPQCFYQHGLVGNTVTCKTLVCLAQYVKLDYMP